MKLLLIALFAAGPVVAAAQDAPDAAVAAQRARIAAERARVEGDFKLQERACWGKFAVNDCLAAARAKRREALSDLRRQDISLNDAERKQRGAARQRSIEERSAPAGQPAASAGRPRARDERDAQAAQRAADLAARQAGRTPRTEPAGDARQRAAERQQELERKAADRGARDQDAVRNVQRREEQQRQAQERKERLQRRLAARQKAPAAPLPAPAD
ncbi:hypothetical protein [Ramlibacter sp.]|uniref:hypothetical protein n=1 Tax=Ramlibacter sp. TaxID=1917967 RepID=UPI002B729E0F|nr:hypothetical protein [Ramlibacter sp.]HWI81661.1 hypothetical protein [Ramlibacter sp.]